MLLAGASANSDPAWCGSFTFDAGLFPSGTWWAYGSAFMLVASASAVNPPANVGALTFDVFDTPSWADWNTGSANKNISIPKLV